MTDQNDKPARKRQPFWLIYTALLLSGIVLLGDAYHLARLDRWTIKLAIALIYSALSLLLTSGRAVGLVAAILIWTAVILSFFF